MQRYIFLVWLFVVSWIPFYTFASSIKKKTKQCLVNSIKRFFMRCWELWRRIVGKNLCSEGISNIPFPWKYWTLWHPSLRCHKPTNLQIGCTKSGLLHHRCNSFFLNDSELNVCCTGGSTIIKNIPFSNRLYGLTFISFPTRNIWHLSNKRAYFSFFAIISIQSISFCHTFAA